MEKPRRPEEDAQLLDRILSGDGESFRCLVEKYYDRIFRLVRGIVGDWHLSEDVCQEVFATVYRKLSGFRRRSQFSTWIYRVSVNAALKARKRHRNSQLEELDPLSQLPFVPADSRSLGPQARLEGEEVVRKLLAPLPSKLRVVVVLREQMGLSYVEMADVLGCSRGAVEQRLHRAMVSLREIWKNGGWLKS